MKRTLPNIFEIVVFETIKVYVPALKIRTYWIDGSVDNLCDLLLVVRSIIIDDSVFVSLMLIDLLMS